MELMEGGSLTDVIDNNLCTINEEQMACIIYQTLNGLQHLHKQNIIHRDIKSDNMLVGRNGDVKL
eukprot:Pgem_evm1s9415